MSGNYPVSMAYKPQHISVVLHDNLICKNDQLTHRKRFRRHWNGLSKFQKNIIFVVFFLMILIVFAIQTNITRKKYFISNATEETSSLLQTLKREKQQFYKEQSQNKKSERRDSPDISVIRENKWHFKGPSNQRQEAVVEAFKFSWKNYKFFAWGHDNLKPISKTYHDWFGLGLTIIDALDGLFIMNLINEFEEAKVWVEKSLNFDIDKDVNLFEVTIRVLGGLLGAFHLSSEKIFLEKAIDLGNRLLPCFDSPSGIPFSDINMATKVAHSPKWSPDSSTSEVTTLQLEFKDLGYSSKLSVFNNVVENINEKVHLLEKKYGLVPIFINANTGKFREHATISLGARGDSYYEYLLKQWIQIGKPNNHSLIIDYMEAVDGISKMLVRRTPRENILYIGELLNGRDFKPKMDHLVCFLPGTLLLGYNNGMPKSHMFLAEELLQTCYQTYKIQPTGLAPEITHFNLNGENENDLYVKINDAHNLLRPEFIESLYYFYIFTNDTKYKDMGWEIFQSFNKFTRVKHGYTSIENVKNVLNTKPRDIMESFWLGETLKYFYLLFSDVQEINLDKWVFNTEAHILPIRKIKT